MRRLLIAFAVLSPLAVGFQSDPQISRLTPPAFTSAALAASAPTPGGTTSGATGRQLQSARRSVVPTIRIGDSGSDVRALQVRLMQLDNDVCWWVKRCLAQYRIGIDGRFGPETKEAVEMFQAQQGLHRDGIVGPKTRARLDNPLPACDVARRELLAGGVKASEIERAMFIVNRESGCHLAVTNFNSKTKDESYGPFQVNYYGSLKAWRLKTIGPPWVNTISWTSAVAIFVNTIRTRGWCPWKRPYC